MKKTATKPNNAQTTTKTRPLFGLTKGQLVQAGGGKATAED